MPRQITPPSHPTVHISLFKKIAGLFQNLAPVQAAYYLQDQINQRLPRPLFPVPACYTLSPKHATHPVVVRPLTSDMSVFGQIFIEREYACLDHLADATVIVDCGANVGHASAYFLSRFPSSRLIAVEPDPANFAQLQRNVAPYGARVRALQSAIWSHPADLKICPGESAWATQVRECFPGEHPDLRAVDIATLFAEARCPRISILKMDIEGAEAIVFAKGVDTWLSCVDNLVIELHDRTSFGRASDIFYAAISGHPFDIYGYGELIVCSRRS